MTVKSFEQIIADFNLSAKTEFNKQYEMLPSELQNFAFKYNAGAVAYSNFYVNLLFGDVQEWQGTQEYSKMNKAIQHTITHKEYFAKGLEIETRLFKRAQQANSITGLDMYIKGIGDLARRAKDAPYEKMLELLEAGDASTYGVCFDGQNLFDTTHSYNDSAGTQSNLITGTGATSLYTLAADLKSAISAMRGFYYETDTGNGANSKKRKLNRGNMQLVVVCDSSLYSLFDDLRQIEVIPAGTSVNQTNSLKNKFEIIDHKFDDTNDWFVMDVSDPSQKPFLISMEDEGSLKTPADNPEALTNLQALRYAFNGLSYGIGYGAWWKACKVSNS